MRRRSRTAVRLLALLVLGLLVGPGRANSPGEVLYAPTSPTEFLSYARTIRLQHGGKATSGTLLATFEHRHFDGVPAPLLIERSTDGGKTWRLLSSVADGETGPGHPWTVLVQPDLFELPARVGAYPAGTLLLAANVCPTDVSQTHFQLWRSEDHGAHWAYVHTFQVGGSYSPGRGIWEPFLALDSHGKLVCYFSDERQFAAHSQFLGHLLSPDGGDTWGSEIVDAAGRDPADRPGMATVARLPGGSYLMSYEVCGPHACEVRVKASPDGDDWGDPADLGVRPATGDGRYLANTPDLAWTPEGGPKGELLLTASAERSVSGNGFAPESGQVVFLNTQGGTGAWSWMPGPFHPVTDPAGDTQPNYSPCLLPAPDGLTLRLSTASGGSPGQIRTEVAGSGVLPYADSFVQGTDAGWMDYGGDWSVADGVYSDRTGGAGDKAVAGSTGWTDYSLSADMKLTSIGQAGLLVRVSNPADGVDALNGDYIAIESDNGTLFVGREEDGWTTLGGTTVPGGVALNTWYHVIARVHGSALFAMVRRADGAGGVATLRVADAHFRSGAIGLRAQNTQAAWRHIRVVPLGAPPLSPRTTR